MRPFANNPEAVARAVTLYAKGLSLVEVGTILECNPASVRNVLIQKGVPRRRLGRKKICFGYIDVRGYVRVWDPENVRADGQGFVKEHLKVWEDRKGPVPKGWHVHHINGVKTDNRLENLEALPASAHSSQHQRERLTPGCLSDPRVLTAKIGHALFLKLYPEAEPVSDLRWFAEYAFKLGLRTVEVRTSKVYGQRWHFKVRTQAELLFAVLLDATSQPAKAYLFESTVLRASSIWLGGARGSKYERLARMKFDELPKAASSFAGSGDADDDDFGSLGIGGAGGTGGAPPTNSGIPF